MNRPAIDTPLSASQSRQFRTPMHFQKNDCTKKQTDHRLIHLLYSVHGCAGIGMLFTREQTGKQTLPAARRKSVLPPVSIGTLS